MSLENILNFFNQNKLIIGVGASVSLFLGSIYWLDKQLQLEDSKNINDLQKLKQIYGEIAEVAANEFKDKAKKWREERKALIETDIEGYAKLIKMELEHLEKSVEKAKQMTFQKYQITEEELEKQQKDAMRQVKSFENKKVYKQGGKTIMYVDLKEEMEIQLLSSYSLQATLKLSTKDISLDEAEKILNQQFEFLKSPPQHIKDYFKKNPEALILLRLSEDCIFSKYGYESEDILAFLQNNGDLIKQQKPNINKTLQEMQQYINPIHFDEQTLRDLNINIQKV